MKLNEIHNKKWKISDRLKITKCSLAVIPKEEQECHFNVIKEGFNGDKTETLFDCTFQEWITKLSKSEYVTVKSVLVSTRPRHIDYLLQVTGSLQGKGLRIGFKVPNLSQKEKKRRASILGNIRKENAR